MATPNENGVRSIASSRPFSLKRFFLQWEWMLVIMLLLVVAIGTALSPYFLNFNNIMNNVPVFLVKGLVVFPMMLVLLLGEIDISVGSTMALSGVAMGLVYQAGLPMGVAILAGLATGLVCGLVNGLLLTRFHELSSVIITLSTMIIYRGVARILLETKSVGGFAPWFRQLNYGKIGPVPYIVFFFALEALVFWYFVHKTPFGRRIYAIGSNPVASRFSGIQTDRYRLVIFALNGLFAGIAGIFLASQLSSVNPAVAEGFELEIIAMAVLGGVSTAGGVGNVAGVVLSVFVIGLLRFALGVGNISAQVIMIIVGAVLILAVTIPNLKKTVGQSTYLNRFLSNLNRK